MFSGSTVVAAFAVDIETSLEQIRMSVLIPGFFRMEIGQMKYGLMGILIAALHQRQMEGRWMNYSPLFILSCNQIAINVHH